MRPLVAPIAVVIGFALSSLSAAPVFAVGDLIASFADPTPNLKDNFGFSVAADDDFIYIAAIGDDAAGPDAGAIYVYDALDYHYLRTITTPEPSTDDHVGTYLTTYNGYLLAGAWHEPTNGLTDAGGAFVFDPQTGNTVQHFTSPTPVADDRYGRWLVGVNDRVVVGAYKDDLLGGLTGAAYVYDINTGLQTATLTDPTPAFGDRFGYSLATMGSDVLVAAYRDSELKPNSGGVFVFDSATGDFKQKILNPEPHPGDLFGRSIAVRGHYMVVGAPDDDGVTVDDGSAYLFDVITGDLVATFRNPSPDALDEFGQRVAFVGDNVLVGSWLDDTNGEDSGAAYLFDGVTGELLHTFQDPGADAGNFFGFSVGAVGNDILISAHGTAAPEEQSGAVYLYDGSDFVAAPGDATHDGVVDGADYLRWAAHEYDGPLIGPDGEVIDPRTMTPDQFVRGPADGDFNCDGRADGLDYLIWAANYDQSNESFTPEPSSCGLACAGALLGLGWRRRRPQNRSRRARWPR